MGSQKSIIVIIIIIIIIITNEFDLGGTAAAGPPYTVTVN